MGTNNANEDDHVALSGFFLYCAVVADGKEDFSHRTVKFGTVKRTCMSENKGMNREDMKDGEERKASIAGQKKQKKEMFTFMWALHF